MEQSKGGVWVKASERLPKEQDSYFVLVSNGHLFKKTSYFNGKRFEVSEFGLPVIEWLDESLPVIKQESDDVKIPFTIMDIENWIESKHGYLPGNFNKIHMVRLLQAYHEDFLTRKNQ